MKSLSHFGIYRIYRHIYLLRKIYKWSIRERIRGKHMRTMYPRDKTQKEIGGDSFSSVGFVRSYKNRRIQPLIENISR